MERTTRPDPAVYGELLGFVEKPVRYVGEEWNQKVKPPAPGLARVAFAFPDTYEIGMSHLGLRILYDILNRQDDIAAERVFCPAVDLEAALRRFGLPLATLETRTPLAACDVVMPATVRVPERETLVSWSRLSTAKVCVKALLVRQFRLPAAS